MINTSTRIVWQSMKKEGGWWSISMLQHHWRPTFGQEELTHMLTSLHKGGFVEASSDMRSIQYRVTPNCQALPGLQPTQELSNAN